MVDRGMFTDEHRTDARAVSNQWRNEWQSGCDYETTGEEPDWDTTDIAQALHYALDEIDRLRERRWPVGPDSAKASQVSGVDELLGRMGPGTRITIDIGRMHPYAWGRPAIVSIGHPDAVAREGGWLHGISGHVWAEFCPSNARGDHLFENALFDAFEDLRAGIKS